MLLFSFGLSPRHPRLPIPGGTRRWGWLLLEPDQPVPRLRDLIRLPVGHFKVAHPGINPQRGKYRRAFRNQVISQRIAASFSFLRIVRQSGAILDDVRLVLQSIKHRGAPVGVPRRDVRHRGRGRGSTERRRRKRVVIRRMAKVFFVPIEPFVVPDRVSVSAADGDFRVVEMQQNDDDRRSR